MLLKQGERSPYYSGLCPPAPPAAYAESVYAPGPFPFPLASLFSPLFLSSPRTTLSVLLVHANRLLRTGLSFSPGHSALSSLKSRRLFITSPPFLFFVVSELALPPYNFPVKGPKGGFREPTPFLSSFFFIITLDQALRPFFLF